MTAPKVRRRLALQDKEQEEGESIDLGKGSDTVNKVSLKTGNAESKQEEGDAHFERHVGKDKERFAKPPELSGCQQLILCSMA